MKLHPGILSIELELRRREKLKSEWDELYGDLFYCFAGAGVAMIDSLEWYRVGMLCDECIYKDSIAKN